MRISPKILIEKGIPLQHADIWRQAFGSYNRAVKNITVKMWEKLIREASKVDKQSFMWIRCILHLGTVNLDGIDLSDLDLANMCLRDTSLRNANFRGSKLEWINLGDVDIEGTGCEWKLIGNWRCVATPDNVWVGCEEATNKETQDMTQKKVQNISISGIAKSEINRWWRMHGDELKSMARRCERQGWPKGF